VTIVCMLLKIKSVYDKDSTVQNYSYVRDLYSDNTSYHLTPDVIDFGIRV
jgi:hypothetical protein